MKFYFKRPFFVCNLRKICYNRDMKLNYVNSQKPNAKPPLFGQPTKGKGAGLAFSLSSMMGALMLFVIMLVLAIFGLMKEGYQNTQWYLYLCYILPPVASALIAWYYLRYTKTPVKEAATKQKCHYTYFLLALTLQIGLLSLSELNTLFVGALEKLGYVADNVVLPSMDGFGFVGVFFVVAIMAPIAEEILFRGVILDGLKSGFSTLICALVCGALFSLYHQNPVQTAYQFCCGFAYALLALRAGSVLPTILAHFLNNAFILILNKCGVTAFPISVFIPLMIVSGLCLVTTLVYLFFFDKKQAEGNDREERKKERKNFFVFASVGIAVCAITWITGLFL